MAPPLQLGIGMNLARGGGPKGPIGDYDFLTMSALPSTLIHSRASAATYFDSSGVLQLAATGVPRLACYDPTGLIPRGLLIEPAASTNVCQSSNTIAGWLANGASLASGFSAPDGTLTAALLTDSNFPGGAHYCYPVSAELTAGRTYAMSVFAKAGTHEWFQLCGTSGIFGLTVWANFQLTGDGAVGSVLGSGNTRAYIEKCANGWYRCVLVAAATTTASGSCILPVMTNNTDAGRAPGYPEYGNSLYLWGAQCEEGQYATSLIPTTSGPGVRAAETLTATYGSLWRNGKPHTVLFKWRWPNTVSDYLPAFQLPDNMFIRPYGSRLKPYGNVNARYMTAGVTRDADYDFHLCMVRITATGPWRSLRLDDAGVVVDYSFGTVTDTTTLTESSVPVFASTPNAVEIQGLRIWDRALNDAQMDNELAKLAL